MFNIGDFVVYKRDVCKIIEYKEKYFKDMDYYLLIPVYDTTLKIEVPVNSSFIRRIISREEVERIIEDIPNIEVISLNDKLIENEYKRLLHDGDYIGLIKIIKTTYLRNNDRLNNKRKISEKDDTYFKLAEKYLYSEFAVVLGLSYDETKDYVISRVSKLKEMQC